MVPGKEIRRLEANHCSGKLLLPGGATFAIMFTTLGADVLELFETLRVTA